MAMRRYMAIHTYHSEKTKKAMMQWATENSQTQKEYMATQTHEKCRCLATWIGSDEFFFCHWLAETDEEIHNVLRENSEDQWIFTACYEVPIYLDAAMATDEPAFPINEILQA